MTTYPKSVRSRQSNLGCRRQPDIQHADKLANDLRCRLLVGRYDYIARFLSLREHQNRHHGKELIFE